MAFHAGKKIYKETLLRKFERLIQTSLFVCLFVFSLSLSRVSLFNQLTTLLLA